MLLLPMLLLLPPSLVLPPLPCLPAHCHRPRSRPPRKPLHSWQSPCPLAHALLASTLSCVSSLRGIRALACTPQKHAACGSPAGAVSACQVNGGSRSELSLLLQAGGFKKSAGLLMARGVGGQASGHGKGPTGHRYVLWLALVVQLYIVAPLGRREGLKRTITWGRGTYRLLLRTPPPAIGLGAS